MDKDIQQIQNQTESNNATIAELKTAIANVLEEIRQKELRYDGIDWLVSKLNAAKEDRADSLQAGKIGIAKDFYILPSDRSDYHILKLHKAVHILMRMLQLEYRECEVLSNHWKAELTRAKEFLEVDDASEWSASFEGLWVVPSRMSCTQLLQYANLIKEVEKNWIKKEEDKTTNGAKEIIAKILGEEKKKLAPWERESGPSTPKKTTPKKKEPATAKTPTASSPSTTSKPVTAKQTSTKPSTPSITPSVQTPPKRKAEELLPVTSHEQPETKPKTKEDISQQKLTNFFSSNQKQTSKPAPAPVVVKKESKAPSKAPSKAQKLPENLDTFNFGSFDDEPAHIENTKKEEESKVVDEDLDSIFSESRVRTYKRRRMSAPPVLPELRTSA